MFKVSLNDYDLHNDLERAIFMKNCLKGEYEFTLAAPAESGGARIIQIKKGETVIEWKRFYYDVLLGIPKIIESEKDRFNKDMDEYNKKDSDMVKQIDNDVRDENTINGYMDHNIYDKYVFECENRIKKWREENTFEYDNYIKVDTSEIFQKTFKKISVIKETLEHMAIVLEFS